MARLVLLSTAAAVCLAYALPALAKDPPPNYAPARALEPSDPLEGFNRAMFKVDKSILKAIGGGDYEVPRILPSGMRKGVYNFFSNLGEPVSAANQLLQGKPRRAAVSMGRFGANTTVGLLGTKDVATDMGLQKHKEDFGQTLATYGVPGGPYIYLPLIGPGNLRDRVGGRVDGLVNPLGVMDAGTVGGAAIDGMQSMSQPHAVSIRQRARQDAETGRTDDEYAALRDLYYAKRAAEIEDAGGADRVPPPYWEDDVGLQRASAEPAPAPRDMRREPPPQRLAKVPPPPRYAQGYGPPPPPPPGYRPARRAPAYPPPPPPPAYRYGYARPAPVYYDYAAERAAAQAAADAAYFQSAYVGWDR